MIVIEDFQEPDLKLDLFGGTSGAYAGLDNFNRIVAQLWRDYGASADRDKYTYGYDRGGNRLHRGNATATAKDEWYDYDGGQRLKKMHRGTLDGSNLITDANAAYRQQWSLDPTGNWAGFQVDANGNNSFADAGDQDQTRTSNKANEITAIAETSGQAVWLDPAYDRAGNMTTIPKPSALNTGLTGIFDAWNRLVEVKDGATTIQKNIFDGLNRRILIHIDSQAPASPNGIDRYEHLFYNVAWQLLETRNTTTLSDQPENIQPKYQYLWSPRYIDAAILRDENTDSDGLCDDGRIYFLTDANMNVTTLTDINGDPLERYLYDAYGTVTIYDGTWTNVRTASSYGNVVMFGGYLRDVATLLSYARWRFYQPFLGSWVSRDPGIGQGLASYSYTDSNPLVAADPLGLFCIPTQSCGPDVTAWFLNEVALFRAQAQRVLTKLYEMLQSPTTPHAPQGFGQLVGLAATKYTRFRELALKADYKARQFSHPNCKDPCSNSVSLCGRCIGTNQLGNIMYGVIAADFGLIDQARSYGRGDVPWYYKIIRSTGPDVPWTAVDEAYRETAFDIGIAFATKGGGCALMDMNPQSPVDQGFRDCAPCSGVYTGPQTDFAAPALVDPAGNIPKP